MNACKTRMTGRALIAAAMAVCALAFSGGAAAATAVFDQFTLTYDDSSVLGGLSFSFGSGDQVGFGWTLPSSIFAAGDSASFSLPDFTITANADYVLHGDIGGSIGNLPFSEFVGAPATSTAFAASIAIDGTPIVNLLTPLDRTVVGSTPSVTFGYYSLEQYLPYGTFSTLSFTGGRIDLVASGSAAVYSQAQSEFKFFLSATPVPESGSIPMIFTGLGVIAMITRRRLAR